MTKPVIESLLDTDLYKLTMLQAMVARVPNFDAVYRFRCRNTPEFPLAEIAAEVKHEIEALCSLRFTGDELAYLAGLRYMAPGFVDYLEVYQLRERHIEVTTRGDELVIEARGPIQYSMMFEIYVLSIVNELYFRRLAGPVADLAIGRAALVRKIVEAAEAPQLRTPFEVSDFGTRRRFSREWQVEVVSTLKAQGGAWFKGTSNVDLARRLDLVPIGTMAHEYLQIHQAFGGPIRDFQKRALENWVQAYRGDLGIALTDVISMDAFLADFDLYFAKLFDGLRHDSGDPVQWGEKALAHYARLRLPVTGKRIVFSDGLSMPGAISIYRHFGDRIQTGFGIGTNLTNDVGHKALNIVMKVVEANGQPVAKLSDATGKTMCDDDAYVAFLRSSFK
ncbi:MAG: nicotinate phosphoribosyltransferase [Sulfuritalea sp.]|nr:nicotinate phosphoribosyltransferase [Sulfuritalea sp.]MDP1985144.1 nicotinate phosphoribosyltransferase [Sulfuritalea sp.]